MAKMVEKQMAKLPPEQREMIMALVQENPELFEKIGKEIQSAIKAGQNQQYASMQVMQKYQDEIKAAVAKYQAKK